MELRGEPRPITDTIIALLRQVSETALTSGRTHNLVDPSAHARTIIPAIISVIIEDVDPGNVTK